MHVVSEEIIVFSHIVRYLNIVDGENCLLPQYRLWKQINIFEGNGRI